MSRKQGLGRAAVVGLFAGLVGAALVLSWSAYGNMNFVCEFPDTEECSLELDTHESVARLQLYAAIGMSLIATGLFLALRRKQAP